MIIYGKLFEDNERGLNNLDNYSIRSPFYSDYFGFTQVEVSEMLNYYELNGKSDEVKKWYDGYIFGEEEIFNPWSVIMYLHNYVQGENDIVKTYWANTSGNDILNRIMEWSDKSPQIKRDLDRLIAGKTIVKKIDDYLTYNQVGDTVDNVWSIMFHTGYLTMKQSFEDGSFELYIPNGEVLFAFERIVEKWYTAKAGNNGEFQRTFCQAIAEGNAEAAEKVFSKFLKNTISLRDTSTKSKKENFYHGMLLGLLSYNMG